MLYLLTASLLWAFSFGLIKGHLAGLDPVAVACGRLLLAAAAFAPLLGRDSLPRPGVWRALGLGSIQFGLMYILYLWSYNWLPAWLVALFTVFTPVYVVLMADLARGKLRARNLLAAGLAVAGAGVVLARGLPAGADWRGILVLQGANLCFAFGQVYFSRLRRVTGGQEAVLLAWMYQGAALLTLTGLLVRGSNPLAGWDRDAVLVVLYLGLLPTALGFYLWNKGAARTRPGLLATANNLKVPLAVLMSWLVFNEQADHTRVLIGLALIVLGLFLARTVKPDPESGDIAG